MFRTALSFAARLLPCAVFTVLSLAPSPAQAQTTALFLDSQPGDGIGGGLEYSYTAPPHAFQVSTNSRNGVTVWVQGATLSDYWSLSFSAAGSAPLAVGVYDNAQRLPFAPGHGLEVFGRHLACGDLSGRFIVREIVRGPDGALERFAVDFEQLCDGSGDGSLFGALRYNSTISTMLPFDGAYPTYQLTIVPDAHGRVTANGLDCGGGSSACFVSLTSPASLVLTAVPDAGYEFTGWTGSCSGGVVTTIRINQIKSCAALFESGVQGTTALVLDSQPGDYMGQGVDHAFTPLDGTFLVTQNYRKGLTITLTPPGAFALWRLTFAAAGDVPLTVGSYGDATSFHADMRDGLDVSASGRACSRLTGRFVVHEIVYKSDGTVRRFAADFEQHCEDNAPGLFGAIRFNSTIGDSTPFGGGYPVYRLDVSSGGGGRISGGGLDCGGAGAACQLSLPAPTHISLTAAPDAGYVFAGWSGGCRGSAVTSVHVNGPKTCTALFEPQVSASPRTVLVWESQAGDYIGRGASAAYNLANSQWTASSSNSGNRVSIRIHDGVDWWQVEFAAPQGQPLAVGQYNDAHRPLIAPANGLSISGAGRGCNTLTGRFVILDIALATNGTVQRFAADFEQHCEDHVPALFGVIRFNSAVGDLVPFGGAYPLYQLSVTPPPGGHVTGGGLDCGAAGPVCQLSLPGAARIDLTAVPDAGYGFAGWGGSCRGGAETSVHVNGPKLCTVRFEPQVAVSPRTVMYLESQPGDYIGGGTTSVFNAANSRWTVTSGGNGNRIMIVLDDALDRWRLSFSAPEGHLLAVGEYLDVQKSWFMPFNGLDVSGPGRGCNRVTGRFAILDIAVAPDGTVQRFAADFEQHCEDMVPALFGAIRYNSVAGGLVPFDGGYPSYRLSVVSSVGGRVTGGGLDCGAAGPVCQLALVGATTVTVMAVPEPGYLFAGWSGSCRGDATTTVRVNGPKTCSALFHPATSASPHTVLYLDSQSGDYVGGGAKRIFNLANSGWTVTSVPGGNQLTISLQDPFEQWSLDFSAPAGQPLAVGEYAAARRHPFTLFNGLDVGGAGNGCNELTGRFVILDVAIASDGTVHRFAADFEQHCGDAVPALFGAVRYNSGVGGVPAFGGAYPSYQLSMTTPSGGRITGSSLDCGTGSAQCLLTLAVATQVTITATPDPGFAFMGWTEDCSGGVTTIVHVNGPKRCGALFERPNAADPSTVLRWTSQPGHYIGQGGSETYSLGNSKWTAAASLNGGAVEFDVKSVGPRSYSSWTVRMEAPSGERLLAGRRYTGARRFAGTGIPGLDITGNGRSCSGGGEFTVDEASFGPNNALLRFSATFVLYCGAATSPLLTGALRYTAGSPAVTIDPRSLQFAALHDGLRITALPTAQAVRLSVTNPNVGWVITPSTPWIKVTPSAGTGPATISVAMNLLAMLPTSGIRTGTVTIALTDGSSDAATLGVTLGLLQAGTTAPPFGSVDTPVDNTVGVTGAIPITGWALDDLEVSALTICRAAVGGEVAPVDPNCGAMAQIFVGRAEFVEGARPDVQAAFPGHPRNDAAGWGLMVLTNMLPNQGNGTFVFSVYARDREGNVVRLGTRTMTCDNANATSPFGTLDTPGQGQTVSGSSYVNFGWALTQQPKFIPNDGSTLTVYVDGQPVGSPSYNHFRTDIAAAFPGLANSNGAVGISTLDTTKLSNGLHTIVWSATDSAGVTSGLGSRYFRVMNGASTGVTAAVASSTAEPVEDQILALPLETSPTVGRRSWDPETSWRTYGAGRAVMRGEEIDRFELALGERPGESYSGYMRVGDGLRPLPVGSHLNAETGAFTWSPGVGFIGTYDLVFVRSASAGAIARRDVRFILQPKGSGHVGAQVVIDTPRPHQEFEGSLSLGGWAADLDATSGSGIDTVHVWAYPLTGGDPVFLGMAHYGGARPDVAAVHGDRFRNSGYDLVVRDLPPGPYDLAVFASSSVSGGFVPAQLVRITLR